MHVINDGVHCWTTTTDYYYESRSYTASQHFTRSAVARTRPEKDPPLLMRIYLCLFVLFQMFCIVIPCTSPLSYVVGVKHIVIEALPDLCVCRTLCKYMIPDTFRASLMPS